MTTTAARETAPASNASGSTGQSAERVENADWGAITTELDSYGCALIGPLLSHWLRASGSAAMPAARPAS
jgi:hypothetical protein